MLRLFIRRCLAGMGVAQYLLLALLTTVVLSGCGGGGGGGGVSLDAGAAPAEAPADSVTAPVASSAEVVVDVSGAGRRVAAQDINGRMVTVLISAEYYQPQTVRVSDIAAAFFVNLRAMLPSAVMRDINGKQVTLGGRVVTEKRVRHKVSGSGHANNQTITLAAPQGQSHISTVFVTTTVAVTSTVYTTLTIVSRTTVTTAATVFITGTVAMPGTIRAPGTLTVISHATVTTASTVYVANVVTVTGTLSAYSTLTVIRHAAATAIIGTVISPGASTLTLAPGQSPPAGGHVVATQIVYNGTLHAATLKIVNVTGVVYVNIGEGEGIREGEGESASSPSVAYSYQDSSGQYHPLPAAAQARLLSQGLLSPAAADGSYASTITIVLNTTLAVTATAAYNVTMVTLHNATILATLSATMTTVYEAMLTLHTVYASIVYDSVREGGVALITMDYGVTLGYRHWELEYAVLPPPSDSDGKDYETEEYRSQNGLGQINAAAAYQRGYFGQGVTVAVVDTGVVTTHIDLVDNLVPGKRFDEEGNMYDDVSDVIGYGTGVAGIIGAARNGFGMHGVAPLASIMPLQVGEPVKDIRVVERAVIGNAFAAIQYAVDNNVPIINNSWSGVQTGTEELGGYDDILLAGTYKGRTVAVRIPYASEFMTHPGGNGDFLRSRNNSNYRDDFAGLADIVAASDTVLVWPAGDSDRNIHTNLQEYCDIKYSIRVDSGKGCWTSIRTDYADIEDFYSNFVSGVYTISVSMVDYGNLAITTCMNGCSIPVPKFEYVTPAFGDFATLSISANGGGAYGVAPLFEESLLGHYAVAVGVDADNRIMDSSNACGNMKDWCLAAPGKNFLRGLRSTHNGFYTDISDSDYGGFYGTRMAAAHVSGGLAVLKSRFPHMPMPVVLAILFDTAKDLGEPGVDDVYGHGLMDLDRATSVQGSVNLVIPGGDVAGKLKIAASRSNVGGALAGFADQLEQVSVAVRYLDDRYYNMPLSGLLQTGEQNALPGLGAAAADIMQGEGMLRAQAFGNLSFVQKASDGQFLHLAYQGDWLRLRYDLCADCESSVWEKHYLADSDDTAPYFAEDKQRAFGAANLTDELEIFAAAGLGEEAEESTYTQWGIRWAGTADDDDARWLAEYSQIQEDGSFLGSALQGGLATGDAQTQQGRLAADLPFAGGWRVLADYTYGRGEAAAVSGSMLAGVDYRYSGWNAALAADSLWRANDRMRIGLRRSGRLDGARATFRRGVLQDGDLHTVSDRVRWSDDAVTALHWGYYSEILPDMELGIGYEYARGGDEDAHASSLQLHWRY